MSGSTSAKRLLYVVAVSPDAAPGTVRVKEGELSPEEPVLLALTCRLIRLHRSGVALGDWAEQAQELDEHAQEGNCDVCRDLLIDPTRVELPLHLCDDTRLELVGHFARLRFPPRNATRQRWLATVPLAAGKQAMVDHVQSQVGEGEIVDELPDPFVDDEHGAIGLWIEKDVGTRTVRLMADVGSPEQGEATPLGWMNPGWLNPVLADIAGHELLASLPPDVAETIRADQKRLVAEDARVRMHDSVYTEIVGRSDMRDFERDAEDRVRARQVEQRMLSWYREIMGLNVGISRGRPRGYGGWAAEHVALYNRVCAELMEHNWHDLDFSPTFDGIAERMEELARQAEPGQGETSLFYRRSTIEYHLERGGILPPREAARIYLDAISDGTAT